MELGAREIHEKQFHDAWRGYNQEEVDDFLDRVATTIDRLQRENRAYQQRISELDQAVAASRDTEEMLKKTLVTAQRAAEEAIAQAKSKADHLIIEAEESTKRAQEEAHRKQIELERQHQSRKHQLDHEITRLRSFEEELKNRLRAFLEQQQKALDSLGTPDPPRVERAPDRAPDRPVAKASENRR